MPDVEFHVKNLRQLDRALGAADKSLRKQLRQEFKKVAEVVAVEARAIAGRRTTSRSGDLLAGIRPFSLQGRAGVRSSATHGGFSYPRRLEFEGRQGGKFGPRASLFPAVAAKKQEIREGIDEALEAMERAFARGGGA